MNWKQIFSEAHLHSWPRASLAVQNTKPPNGRNIFKEDEKEIMAAAMEHGYVLVSKEKVACFVKDAPGVLY